MSLLASDTFTDTAGVKLPAHTSDSGHSWTKTPGSDAGNIEIESGGFAHGDTDGEIQNALIAMDAPTADYVVEADFIVFSATNDNFPTLWARANSDCSTSYQVYWDVTGGQLNLRRNVGGSGANVGTSALSTFSSHIKLTLAGAVLTVNVDGTNVISYTDGTPIAAIGRSGIGFHTVGNHLSQKIDNFQVSDAAAGGSAKDAMIHHLRTMGAY